MKDASLSKLNKTANATQNLADKTQLSPKGKKSPPPNPGF